MSNEQSPIKTSVSDGILWGVVAYVCCVCGIVVEGGMPDWAYVGPFDARRWKEVLADQGADERAQHALFLLAQYNPEGARQANLAVNRLSRMPAGGQRVQSESSVIQGTVTTAWTTMKDQGDCPRC